MSPEKPTPQHDDEATRQPRELTDALLRHRWRPDGDDPRAAHCICGWSAIVARTTMSALRVHSEHQIEALKEAGFEITKRTELGVTKGLPGLGDGLTRFTRAMAFAGQEAGKDMAGGLELLAPGATQAAKTGFELARRAAAQAEADLAAKRAELDLAAALDLIGRRTDIVAVQLPEPDYTHRGQTVWKVGDEIAVILDEHGDVTTYFQDFWDDDDHRPAPGALRIGAAVMLAAAARQELVIGDDAAEGEAK